MTHCDYRQDMGTLMSRRKMHLYGAGFLVRIFHVHDFVTTARPRTSSRANGALGLGLMDLIR